MATKECVACAEQIQENAKLCRLCGTMQNDRRFVTSVASVPSAPAQTLAAVATRKAPQKLCSECATYVVDEFYDRCEVCRGVSAMGTLPEFSSTEASGSAGEGSAQAKVSYNNVPLGPTPGIAIAAIIAAFIVPVLGLILGYSARAEVRNSTNPTEGDALATGAIIVSWIWVGILVLWMLVVIGTVGAASSRYY